MNDLRGKTVAITGASSGIGSQVAIQAAMRGANVILMARRITQLNDIKKMCDQFNNGNSQVYKLDVSNMNNIDEVVADIYSKNIKIDVLLNAAGFGDFTNFAEVDFSTVENMFKVNVLGMMYLTRLIAAKMIKNESGHILNVGSMAGKIPTPKAAAYSATKAAVIAFSDSLRQELYPFNINVTTINPGPVDTDFFDIADHTGEYLKTVNFVVLDPEKLAIEIVDTFGHKKREINRPQIMNIASVLYKMAPNLGDMFVRKLGNMK